MTPRDAREIGADGAEVHAGCATCDGAGTVEVSQHRGSALSGGGGTPREAPCPTCAVERRERWEREEVR